MSETTPLVTVSRDALVAAMASTWIDSPVGRLLVGAEFGRETCAAIADALLASGVVRAVDGLAEDEALSEVVWSALDDDGHNGIQCNPARPMDYTADAILRALAAALATPTDPSEAR